MLFILIVNLFFNITKKINIVIKVKINRFNIIFYFNKYIIIRFFITFNILFNIIN